MVCTRGTSLLTASVFASPADLQALLLHNAVIKHAVYDNVGWVIEQEGDSFSVAFHDAEDAVAFTLQVCVLVIQCGRMLGKHYDVVAFETAQQHSVAGHALFCKPQAARPRANA
jgi:hypothetical protein